MRLTLWTATPQKWLDLQVLKFRWIFPSSSIPCQKWHQTTPLRMPLPPHTPWLNLRQAEHHQIGMAHTSISIKNQFCNENVGKQFLRANETVNIPNDILRCCYGMYIYSIQPMMRHVILNRIVWSYLGIIGDINAKQGCLPILIPWEAIIGTWGNGFFRADMYTSPPITDTGYTLWNLNTN